MAGGRIEIEVAPDLRAFPAKLKSGLSGVSGIASSIGKGLGLAVAAGTAIAAVGIKNVITLGNDYTANLNEMQAVSGATADQMAKVGQVAKALGSDMTLPATSAADAAAAMVELTKGGLSVAEAMDAAKGTLQLAAAAQVDGATAAEIQSSALNAFGLSAGQAGKVADVLANTANAAAGSIVDIGNSMKYVAPVAAALKVPIEDTASAIGLLANQGVKGEQAGTSLRGILASLASPSAAAAEGLKTLGVEAFDAQGKFIGLRAFTDQLAQAKGRLTDAEFAAAASTAFGNEGLTAANALAAEGAAGFDSMATAVSRVGGAADVAAARTKGLGGAWEGFKSQLETAGIGVYEVIAPPLERATRLASEFVADFTPKIVTGLRLAVAAGEQFGPGLADAMLAKGQDVANVAGVILRPLADGIRDSINSAINLGIVVFGGFADVVREAAAEIEPLTEGVGDLIESINRADGPVGALGAGLGVIYDVVGGVVDIMSPVAALIGSVASAFAGLPGPIQAAATAILLFKFAPSILGGLRNAFAGTASAAGETSKQAGLFGRSLNTVLSPVRAVASGVGSLVGTVRQFNDEARVQQRVASGAGVEVGRLAAATAAFHTSTIPAVAVTREFATQTAAIRAGAAAAGQPISVMGAAIGTLVERSPALSAMRASFDAASDGAARFSRTAGVAAAAGKGLQLAGAGLVGAMGGPLGLAIAGVGVGLSLLADKQQRAKANADRHRAAVLSLAEAMREAEAAGRDTGDVFRDDVISSLSGEFAKATDFAAEFGIGMRDLVDAITEGGPALDSMRQRLAAMVEEDPLSDQGQKAAALLAVIQQLAGRYTEAQVANERYSASAEGSLLGATAEGQQLADAMGVLADKTASADDRARALKDALDALNGGQISLEQANARVNEQLARLAELFGENVDKTKGWGQALLNADGRINTATENGGRLLDIMDDLGGSMAEVAQRTYDTARAQGDTIPVAMEKARVASENVRAGFIAQGEALGLLPEQVQALADQYELVPEKVLTLIQAPGMTATQAELLILKQLVDQVPENKPIVVKSLSDEAKQKLLDLGFTVRTLPDGTVEVIANTAKAKSALDEATKPRTVTITAIYRGASNTPYGTMNPLGSYPNALGNIITPYAAGGVHRKFTPMKAGLAAVVPPNSWRIVGDRLRDDEFYIPDNDDPRSVSLGLEWARRRGLVLARKFAEGGVAASATTSGTQSVLPAGTVVNMPISVQDNRSAYEVARVASSQVAFAARFGG